MTQNDAIPVHTAWRDLVIYGSKSVVEQLLNRIDDSLPSDWSRNTEAEERARRRGTTTPQSRCYVRRLDGYDVWLWLSRASDSRLQGGLVEPTRRDRYLEDGAEAILDFRTRVLELAADGLTLVLLENRVGPHSKLTGTVQEKLWSFQEASGLEWPIREAAARAWREFVIAAYLSRAIIITNELEDWLIKLGWTRDRAGAVIDRLETDIALLGEYEEAEIPA
ncbi:MAG: hypothetical protein K2P78_10630 [Gemmataceae bacterium]|nr:hypothetical protein [Gemmataceae bacterium]